MLVETPESKQFEDAFDGPQEPVAPESIDDMFDGPETPVSESPTSADDSPADLPITEEAQTPAAPEPLSEDDLAERLWWDKCEVLGKISECSQQIEDIEKEVAEYQDSIKEAKEILKGELAKLSRYSSQLREILAGHPLPTNPNTPETPEAPSAGDGTPDAAAEANDDWRALPTSQLLDGVKGLGKKKLESILELAPTAGKLEDLRGEASRAHQMFREVLPKGCGESLADEIENRLIEHVAKFSRFELEPSSDDDGNPMTMQSVIKLAETVDPADAPEPDEEYEDVE